MRSLDELSTYACSNLANAHAIPAASALAFSQWVSRTNQGYELEGVILTITPPNLAIGTGVINAKCALARGDILPDSLKYLDSITESGPSRASSTAVRPFSPSYGTYDWLMTEDIHTTVSVFSEVQKTRQWCEKVLAKACTEASAAKTKALLSSLGDHGKKLAGALRRYDDAKAICDAIMFVRKLADASRFFEQSVAHSIMQWVMDPRMMPIEFYTWFQNRYAGPDGFWQKFHNVEPTIMMKRQFAVAYERISRAVLKKQDALSFTFQPTEVQ